MKPTIQQVRDLRANLYDFGYRPVPINAGMKYPYQTAWTELARRDPPYAVEHVDAWALGTGILCDGLVVIDIDVEDASVVQQITDKAEDMFGWSPVRYRDNSARQLRVYAAEGEPHKAMTKNKKTGAMVELLGHGNQFFSHGDHPSGVPLRWRGGDGPETVLRSMLGRVTEARKVVFLDWCAALIGATRTTYGTPAQSGTPMSKPATTRVPTFGSSSNVGSWLIGDVQSALDAIPNSEADYDFWFQIGCAVHAVTGGSPEGYAAWRDWSSHCPAHSDAMTAHVWSHLHDGGISGGTLVHHATKHDPLWDKPSRRFSPLNLNL